MATILEWPRDWYKFTSSQFFLQSVTLGTRSIYSPVRTTRLSYQMWRVQCTVKQEVGPSKWQDREAWFARLDGEAGVFRMGDLLRCQPKFNRQNKFPQEPWSDNTLFSDGTGWLSANLVPPSAILVSAARMGDSNIVISGLPVSMPMVLSDGDLLEIRPNGIPSYTSNLYEVVRGSATNDAGEAGIEIRPRLRQNFAAGDMVILQHARGVFMLQDSDQGAMYRDSNVGSFGFGAEEYVG